MGEPGGGGGGGGGGERGDTFMPRYATSSADLCGNDAY